MEKYTIQSISDEGIYYLVSGWDKKKTYWYSQDLIDTKPEKVEDFFSKPQYAKSSLTKLLKVMDDYANDTFKLVKFDDGKMTIIEEIKWNPWINAMKNAYVWVEHTGKPEEDIKQLLHKVKDAQQLAAWYYFTSDILKVNFITRLKDVFLNSQENIKKVVFEYDQTIITYEELLNAIVENFNGITKQMLAPYLTEN